MDVRRIAYGIICGIIFHIFYIFFCARFFINDHARMFNSVVVYGIFYVCALLVVFFLKKRDLGVGMVLALITPILLFIVIQFLVILDYRGVFRK